jgi:hypothetical protein
MKFALSGGPVAATTLQLGPKRVRTIDRGGARRTPLSLRNNRAADTLTRELGEQR